MTVDGGCGESEDVVADAAADGDEQDDEVDADQHQRLVSVDMDSHRSAMAVAGAVAGDRIPTRIRTRKWTVTRTKRSRTMVKDHRRTVAAG